MALQLLYCCTAVLWAWAWHGLGWAGLGWAGTEVRRGAVRREGRAACKQLATLQTERGLQRHGGHGLTAGDTPRRTRR